MNTFSGILRITGLSQAEASDFLSGQLDRPISKDTIKSMCSGRTSIRQDVLDALRGLYLAQTNAAEEALNLIDEMQAEHGPPESLDFSSHGRASEWPSLRVAENVAAFIQLESGIFEIS